MDREQRLELVLILPERTQTKLMKTVMFALTANPFAYPACANTAILSKVSQGNAH